MEFVPVIIFLFFVEFTIILMKVVIIGGGIAGCAAAILLAKYIKGVEVEIFEQQGKEIPVYGGRSLNITICERGWSVLETMGCVAVLKNQAVLMTCREVHLPDGSLRRSPYEYVFVEWLRV
jgi:2-polyprenyl-6-methoxyphenol hydroxylase-like FAD-dependent oxidoreductase